MILLGAVISAVLSALAVLHLLWAIGLWVPIREEAGLARAVIGTAGVTTMPGAIPCALVAMAILFAAILPHNPGFPGRLPLMALISLIFLARGLAAYLPAWRRITPEAAFSRNDRRLYGPLCTALGIGYLILTVGEL